MSNWIVQNQWIFADFLCYYSKCPTIWSGIKLVICWELIKYRETDKDTCVHMQLTIGVMVIKYFLSHKIIEIVLLTQKFDVQHCSVLIHSVDRCHISQYHNHVRMVFSRMIYKLLRSPDLNNHICAWDWISQFLLFTIHSHL